MSQAKVPSVVLFCAFGRSVPALVLSSRSGEVSHLGANDEPLLTLAIVKQPAPDQGYKKPVGVQAAVAVPEIEIQHDVVHCSHEFDEEFKKKYGSTPAQIAAQRGHGEWREYTIDDSPYRNALSENSFLRGQLAAAESAAAKQKARADLAESVAASLRKEAEDKREADKEPPAQS
jgi:hypothetical protein